MRSLNVVKKLKHRFAPTPLENRIEDDVGTSVGALLEGLQVACKLTPQGVIPFILLPNQTKLGQTLVEALKQRGAYHGIKDDPRKGWFFNQFKLHCGCLVNVLSTTALNN